MRDIKRARRVLKEVLEDKKDNLIKLYFDWYFRFVKYPNLGKRIKRIQSELDVARVMKGKSTKTKERIILLEKELKELQEASNNLAFIGDTIEKAKELVEVLEECVKNPSKVFEYEKQKKKISRKRR